MANSKANAQLLKQHHEEDHNVDHLSSFNIQLDAAVLPKKTEDGADEDGYTTPTSPRHRIPMPVECPPAPKKAARRRKRSGRCWIVNGDLEMMSFLMEVDDGMWKMRKRRLLKTIT